LRHSWTICFAVITLGWIVQGLRSIFGLRRLPHLRDAAALPAEECPSVTIIFAARDEEEKLPAALDSMLALDYPGLQIIAVNDRSVDATGAIMDAAAARDARLRVVQVSELPAGWLGKTHALDCAAREARGEWLLFTDADVHFAPDALRRAMFLALRDSADHLTLLAQMVVRGFWEKVVLPYFGLGFVFGSEMWRVPDPRSRRYMGVGAFQLVRRAAYESCGGHRRLALEVIDDMKLGRMLKRAGFRSRLAFSDESVRVRWHAGLGNLVRGVEKNFFAGVEYRLWAVALAIAVNLFVSVAPVVALFTAAGWTRIFAAAAMLSGMAVEAFLVSVITASVPMAYAVFHPLGALIFDYMLARSAAITLWNGGITWRGTFYPLDQLRRALRRAH
jgi:glycosyltransferase involved in cell wall biosynthesis